MAVILIGTDRMLSERFCAVTTTSSRAAPFSASGAAAVCARVTPAHAIHPPTAIVKQARWILIMLLSSPGLLRRYRSCSPFTRQNVIYSGDAFPSIHRMVDTAL